MNIVLVEKNGCLYYPDYVKDCYSDPGPILLYLYPEGDCDTVDWPKPKMDHLVSCLFDGREMGYTHIGDVVMLPDRTVVEF